MEKFGSVLLSLGQIESRWWVRRILTDDVTFFPRKSQRDPFGKSNQRNLVEIVTLGFNPSHTCRQFRCVKRMRYNASLWITEIETLRLNPSAACTRRFRRYPTKAGLMISESAAMCGGGDACVKKTAGMWGGVCAFSSAGALASIARVPIPRSSLLSQRLISLWLSLFIFLWHQRKKRADESSQAETLLPETETI